MRNIKSELVEDVPTECLPKTLLIDIAQMKSQIGMGKLVADVRELEIRRTQDREEIFFF
jgi:hypothetical protein